MMSRTARFYVPFYGIHTHEQIHLHPASTCLMLVSGYDNIQVIEKDLAINRRSKGGRFFSDENWMFFLEWSRR